MRLRLWLLLRRMGRGDIIDQAEAEHELVERYGVRAVKPLVKAIASGNDKLRVGAWSALKELRDPRAVTPLLPVLKNGREEVRRDVADLLGALGDSRAIGPLSQALEDEAVKVRLAAGRALVALYVDAGPAERALIRAQRTRIAELHEDIVEKAGPSDCADHTDWGIDVAPLDEPGPAAGDEAPDF